jgi:hypothetical protein
MDNPWWLTQFGGDTLVLDCTDAFGRTDTMPTFVYAHLANSIAEVGQRVKKGQVIAITGNTGTATSGPHCHVERMNPGFDLHNNVYGRSPLNFDEYFLASNGIDPQGTTTPKDGFDMAEVKDVVDAIFKRKLTKGGLGGTITLEAATQWSDYNFGQLSKQIAASDAKVTALIGAVNAVAKGEKFDEAKLLASIEAASERGVKAAIDSIDTTVNLKD